MSNPLWVIENSYTLFYSQFLFLSLFTFFLSLSLSLSLSFIPLSLSLSLSLSFVPYSLGSLFFPLPCSSPYLSNYITGFCRYPSGRDAHRASNGDSLTEIAQGKGITVFLCSECSNWCKYRRLNHEFLRKKTISFLSIHLLWITGLNEWFSCI